MPVDRAHAAAGTLEIGGQVVDRHRAFVHPLGFEPALRSAPHRRRHRAQERPAVPPIGLDVVAFCPLVPGLQEHDAFVGGKPLHRGRPPDASRPRTAPACSPRGRGPRAPERGVLSQFATTIGSSGCGPALAGRGRCARRRVRVTGRDPTRTPARDGGPEPARQPRAGRGLVDPGQRVGVETVVTRVPSTLALADEVEAGEPLFASECAPLLGERVGVGQLVRAVHDEQRPPVDAEVPLVAERRQHLVEVALVIVGAGIRLFDQHAAAVAGPDRRSRPGSPRPRQKPNRGWPLVSTSRNGRSRSWRPANQ